MRTDMRKAEGTRLQLFAQHRMGLSKTDHKLKKFKQLPVFLKQTPIQP